MLRILLIEDQRDIAANIWDYLEFRGFVMDHAADGANGLRMALDGSYDVIVLDLGLPKLDGIDLCRALRAAGPGQAQRRAGRSTDRAHARGLRTARSADAARAAPRAP